jgi:hypothetical protein
VHRCGDIADGPRPVPPAGSATGLRPWPCRLVLHPSDDSTTDHLADSITDHEVVRRLPLLTSTRGVAGPEPTRVARWPHAGPAARWVRRPLRPCTATWTSTACTSSPGRPHAIEDAVHSHAADRVRQDARSRPISDPRVVRLAARPAGAPARLRQGWAVSRGECTTSLTWDPREGSHRPDSGQARGYPMRDPILRALTPGGPRPRPSLIHPGPAHRPPHRHRDGGLSP